MWPKHWRDFVEHHQLRGKEVEIPESADLSGVGATVELFSEEDSREEAESFYPGIVVKADGFIPVGGCTIGIGDPYFINTNDNPPGPLYRVYHDEIRGDMYDRESAVEKVLDSYAHVLNFVDD